MSVGLLLLPTPIDIESGTSRFSSSIGGSAAISSGSCLAELDLERTIQLRLAVILNLHS
jgi:hypothetical protein